MVGRAGIGKLAGGNFAQAVRSWGSHEREEGARSKWSEDLPGEQEHSIGGARGGVGRMIIDEMGWKGRPVET